MLREAIAFGSSTNFDATSYRADNDMEAWGGYLIDQVAAKAENSIKFQPNLILLHVGTQKPLFSFSGQIEDLAPETCLVPLLVSS